MSFNISITANHKHNTVDITCNGKVSFDGSVTDIHRTDTEYELVLYDGEECTFSPSEQRLTVLGLGISISLSSDEAKSLETALKSIFGDE